MIKDKEYYESLDKRTNEFKEWKALQAVEEIARASDLIKEHKEVVRTNEELIAIHSEKSKGLGDTVEKLMKITGVDKLVKFVAGEDCGCDERKDKLNDLFRYKNPLCLNEEEYAVLDDILNRDDIKSMRRLNHTEQADLLKVWNRIFQSKKPTTSCNQCGAELVKELRAVYNTYQ